LNRSAKEYYLKLQVWNFQYFILHKVW
jgi:hypothetical protein